MVNITGPGASAPYSKSPTLLSPPPGVFPPQLTRGHQPLFSMSKKSDEAESLKAAQEQLVDVDDPMDGKGDDMDDETDSYGSDYESIEDPPDYLSVEGPEVATQSFSIHGDQGAPAQPSSQEGPLTNDTCVVCRKPKQLKDFATCGNPRCDQQLKSWQGHGPPRSSASGSGPPSRNQCPVCNNFKKSDDIICASAYCIQRLRFWQEDGFPTNPRPSLTSNARPGSSSYAATVQTRSQTRAGGQMCAVCHQRPRYSHNGKTYPTCGLTCAAKLTSGAVEMCDFCHQRPKVVINGKVYPHCGRTCRDKSRAGTSNNGIGTGTCTTCLNCWKAPGEIQKDEFCSDACRAIIEHRAPLLLEVPRGHTSFNAVENEFKNAWNQRKAPCPTIKKVYMVCIPTKQEANFKDYGKKVTSYGIPGGFISRKKEELRWIPGLRDCPLGHPGIMTPCEAPQCQLCNILRGTYLPEIFNQGISTMSLSRAAAQHDHWAANAISIRTSKIVLLSRVFIGKVVELDRFQVTSVPPAGANSVKIVNYSLNRSRVDDEIVVYSCEALRPVYLISYD